ncbi:MAG: hypothetical protein ACXABY_12395 [Candidatus Thorarchaeota archaeon]|jgi:hypothetical protein
MKITKEERAVAELCDVMSEAGLNSSQLIKVVAQFLFSIGASLEKCELSSSKEVLLRYASNLTLGNALMAQALQMKETGKEKADGNE